MSRRANKAQLRHAPEHAKLKAHHKLLGATFANAGMMQAGPCAYGAALSYYSMRICAAATRCDE
jgi:hypothetical protein